MASPRHAAAHSSRALRRIARDLRDATHDLAFAAPVTYVYRPLDYAWAPHARYLERYGARGADVLLVGMNPGPFGMAQTGVPFGDVGFVRDWLGIEAPVGRPATEHPQRPVRGFATTRREVSGQRVWGWARDVYEVPERFFARFFVWNYCPLAFVEATGRNRTPDKLPSAERATLYAPCDAALRAIVRTLRPSLVVGIGRFAYDRAAAIEDLGAGLALAPHPSPANPAANRGWRAPFEAALRNHGVSLP